MKIEARIRIDGHDYSRALQFCDEEGLSEGIGMRWIFLEGLKAIEKQKVKE